MKIVRRLLTVAVAGCCLFVGRSAPAAEPVHVLVWDEQQPDQKKAYDDKFLGETIAAFLNQQPGIAARTARLDDPQQGRDDALLDSVEVMISWSHKRANQQKDDRAEAIVKRVQEGKLAYIALHSAHWDKAFVRLMQERAKADAIQKVPEADRAKAKWEFTNDKPIYKGVTKDAQLTPFVEHSADNVWKLTLPQCVFPEYRTDGAPSHLTTLLPKHPIAAGLPEHWDIPQTEMYNEPFHVPEPDEVIFEEKWDKGEHFRAGCVWKVGQGRVFYFRPGHETYPVYKQTEPLRVIENAVRWLANPKS